MAVSSLENKYYQILCMTMQEEGCAVFRVALLPDCEAYCGHFPGRPVCPGVCQVEMARQCAERLSGCKLYIKSIGLCRFLAVASPDVCPEVEIAVALKSVKEGTWLMTARLFDERAIYMEFKGEVGV